MPDDHNNRKILAIDDDIFNLHLISEVCSSAGFEVIESEDPENAVELARTHRPDLVLLDILMGSRDGFQVCQDLRATPDTAKIPIIMVTAVNDLESKIRGIELGAEDYITKPFRMFDLQSRIKALIDPNQAVDDAPDSRRLPGRVGGYRELRRELEYEFQRANRYKRPLAVAMVRIDQYGQLVTDDRNREAAHLVAAVLTVVQRSVREVDRIYRMDNDIFVVVLPETGQEPARQPVDRICEHLSKPEASRLGPVAMTVSLAHLNGPGISSARDLVRKATDQLKSAPRGKTVKLIDSNPASKTGQ